MTVNSDQLTVNDGQNGTGVLISSVPAPTDGALRRATVDSGVTDREMRSPPVVEGGEDRTGVYEVRCPNCHALQFLARGRWECVAIDEAIVAIKCWRRTCKRVLGLRPVEAREQRTEDGRQKIEVNGG